MDQGRVPYADGPADTLHPLHAEGMLRLLYAKRRKQFGDLLREVVIGEPDGGDQP